MTKPKEVAEPRKRYISGLVREDMWREFRAALMRRGLDVTKGLEIVIAEWLAKA